jgi:hypothetical protein
MMKKYDSQFGLDQRDESLRIKRSITRGAISKSTRMPFSPCARCDSRPWNAPFETDRPVQPVVDGRKDQDQDDRDDDQRRPPYVLLGDRYREPIHITSCPPYTSHVNNHIPRSTKKKTVKFSLIILVFHLHCMKPEAGTHASRPTTWRTRN